MEKKESVKISLSTFFLILAIIAILVMGIFMVKIYNEKLIESKKAVELQNQVNTLSETIEGLQNKINNINNIVNENLPTMKDESEEIIIEGIYKNKNNVEISFDKEKFNIQLDKNFGLNGVYEITENKVVCNISEYTFNEPEEVKKHAIDEKWSMSFEIDNEKNLEVKEITIPDDEVEIVITTYNLIEVGNKFLKN